MNINEFKKHLKDIHGSLDYIDETGQLNHTLYEGYDTLSVDPSGSQNNGGKSTTKEPTTEAGKSLKPHSSRSEKVKDVTLEYMNNYFGDYLNEETLDEDIMESIANLNMTCDATNEYFEVEGESDFVFDETIVNDFMDAYFGDSLNEETSEEDIIDAIISLNETCDSVNEFFEVDEGFFSKVGKGAVGALAAYGAYKGGKYLAGKHKERSARLKADKGDAAKHRSNVAVHQKKTAQGKELSYRPKRDRINRSGDYTPATSSEKRKFRPSTIRSITPRESRKPIKISKVQSSDK